VEISVVIPTFNEEKNIKRTLLSLNNQDFPRDRYEIIVVDGFSKDKTVEIAEKYADKVIYQKSPRVAGARNDGARISKGWIIATTDADTLIPSHWIRRIYENFKNDRSLVGLSGPMFPLENSLKARVFFLMSFNAFPRIISTIAPHFHAFTFGPNSAFLKKAFMKVGGYSVDIGISDDVEITMRIKKYGRLKFDKNLFVYTSSRRFERYGYLRMLYIYDTTAFKLFVLKKRDDLKSIKYTGQIYE